MRCVLLASVALLATTNSANGMSNGLRGAVVNTSSSVSPAIVDASTSVNPAIVDASSSVSSSGMNLKIVNNCDQKWVIMGNWGSSLGGANPHELDTSSNGYGAANGQPAPNTNAVIFAFDSTTEGYVAPDGWGSATGGNNYKARTLAEVAFGNPAAVSIDISLVKGFNVPVMIEMSGGDAGTGVTKPTKLVCAGNDCPDSFPLCDVTNPEFYGVTFNYNTPQLTTVTFCPAGESDTTAGWAAAAAHPTPQMSEGSWQQVLQLPRYKAAASAGKNKMVWCDCADPSGSSAPAAFKPWDFADMLALTGSECQGIFLKH